MQMYVDYFPDVFFPQYCVVSFIISFLSSLFWFLVSSPGVACNYCWSQVLNADFILPEIGQHNFLCIVEDFWLYGSPLMNWQASASSNIFCLSQVLLLHSEESRDFMKLWFSSAGERRPNSWSTKIDRQLTVGNGLEFSLFTSWAVSSSCLHYMIKVPLTPTPAWELEKNPPVLTESGTVMEELVLNVPFQSMEDGMKEDGILLEIIDTSFYAEEGKCLVPVAATSPGLFCPFSLRLSSGSWGIPHFSPNNLESLGPSGWAKDAAILSCTALFHAGGAT